MARRIKLKDIIDHGLLKPNEEVYMNYRGFYFTARITTDGKFKTKDGIFKSMPEPTFINLIQDPEYKRWYIEECIGQKMEDVYGYSWKDLLEDRKNGNRKKAHIVSGWIHWKTWNGTPLLELRKKIDDTGGEETED